MQKHGAIEATGVEKIGGAALGRKRWTPPIVQRVAAGEAEGATGFGGDVAFS